MPKQKSHRGAAKRFSFTKTGIVKHKQMNANHQVRLKTTKRTRHCGQRGGSQDHPQAAALQVIKPIRWQGGYSQWHVLRDL